MVFFTNTEESKDPVELETNFNLNQTIFSKSDLALRLKKYNYDIQQSTQEKRNFTFYAKS